MDIHEWPRCVKTARQKKRLVKTDRDKQLIQLHKRRNELWEQKWLLPMVPLAQPYQRGWKRFFVLSDECKWSSRADFYEELLTKINTVEYNPERSFTRKKRRKRRNVYVVKSQLLREFCNYSWQVNRMKLTEQEQACFTRVAFTTKQGNLEDKYVITEPWRYRLKVAPHIITHTKLLDVDIERELSYIDNHIDNHHLEPRINLLTRGKGYHYGGWFNEPNKYINKLKNRPKYANKEAYLELET